VNLRTSGVVAPTLVAGGFDPIGVSALVGDTLEVAVTEGAGATTYTRVVAIKVRPPRVVRTSPPKGQTDVPLNAVIVIVISEPVDPATVNSNDIRLQLGPVAISGSLELDPSGTVVRFTPATTLLPATTYQLEITGALTDRSGTPLDAPTSVGFTTGEPVGSGPVATVTVVPGKWSMVVGDSLAVTAELRNGDGTLLTGREVTWAVVGPAIATLSPRVVSAGSGRAAVVTAVDTGQTFLTATSEGISRHVTITVFKDRVLTMTPSPVTLQVGQVTVIRAEAPQGLICYNNDAWQSDSPAVATAQLQTTVSAWVTGVSPGGPIHLTARATCADGLNQMLGDVLVTVVAAPITPSGLEFASVSAGIEHTCGLTTSGAAYCWGNNAEGQLGNGTRVTSWSPVAVAGGLTFTSLNAGGNHTCGVTTAGVGFCWGYNEYGQLGDGTTGSSVVPVAVAGGHTFRTLSLASWRTCGVTTGSAAYCWGYDYDQAADDGSFSSVLVPALVPGGLSFGSVSVSDSHVCGVTTIGDAYCWGPNYVGELGVDPALGPRECADLDWGGFYPCSLSPVRVMSGGIRFNAASAGSGFSCGIASTGGAYCWGSNLDWQLGNGTPTAGWSPRPVAGGLAFASVSSGDGFACGVVTDGRAYCWGSNEEGDLGVGAAANIYKTSTPVAVAGGLTFRIVSAGDSHACGVTTAGAVYCWGNNQYGQLGLGIAGVVAVAPVKVSGP
jgi:alpha-tubulin suppressor-like RCC1 family protein